MSQMKLYDFTPLSDSIVQHENDGLFQKHNPNIIVCYDSFAIDAFYPASSFKMMTIVAENVVFCCSILHKL